MAYLGSESAPQPEPVPVTDFDVSVEAYRNQIFREVNYQDECTLQRIAVLGKLTECGALRNGDGWALFHIGDEEDGSLLSAENDRYIVVVSLTKGCVYQIGENVVPHIRIYTNEPYRFKDEDIWLVREVSLDPYNNVRYSVDATDPEDDEGKELRASSEPSSATVFDISDNGNLICSLKIKYLPEDHAFTAVNDSLEPFRFAPLGDKRDTLPDRLYALERAKELISQVMPLIPQYKPVFTD